MIDKPLIGEEVEKFIIQEIANGWSVLSVMIEEHIFLISSRPDVNGMIGLTSTSTTIPERCRDMIGYFAEHIGSENLYNTLLNSMIDAAGKGLTFIVALKSDAIEVIVPPEGFFTPPVPPGSALN